jgi:signal transduction histidine kinase
VTNRGPRSLRARAVVSAGAGVLVGGLLVAVVAVITVTGAATRSLDDTLHSSANDVIAQLKTNPPKSGDPISLPALNPRDPVVVQVVDQHGAPIATTPGVTSDALICPTTAPEAGEAQTVELAWPGLTGTFRVLSVPLRVGGQSLQVCAARSDSQVESTRNSVLVVLAVTIPIITVLVCLLVARQVGRALEAVSDLTDEAERLRTLDEGRLPVPATGDEVADLAVTLNTLLDRLHDQSTATRQFVADAGHELRTPLTSLRIALELGHDGPVEAVAWTDDALLDVDRLTTLVDDLLVLARADSGEKLHPVTLVLPDAVQDEVARASRLREGVTVTCTGHVSLQADARALRRALGNLLTNAVQHATTHVELACSIDGDRVVLEVTDDGPGIPADQVHRVFERFVRLDPSRSRDDGGSGLGLAIVAAFAEQSHGDVTACPGPGGRFLLHLPAG